MRALVLLSLLASACHPRVDEGYAVALTIAPGNVAPALVASLQFEVSGDESLSQAVPLPAPFAKGAEKIVYKPLPTTKVLRFEVIALDASMSPLGSGLVDVTLSSGTVEATLTLVAGALPDLAGTDGGGADLAGPQMLTVTVDTGASDMGADNPQGKVVSDVGGIDCGASCTATLPGETVVTLTASTTIGTGSWFSGWGGDCASASNQPTCQVTMTQARNVTAKFDRINYMFVTSVGIPLPFAGGGTNGMSDLQLQAADQHCATLATSASLPGTRWTAWLSVQGTGVTTGANHKIDAKDRIAATMARGWLRPDDLPFGDSVDSIVDHGVPVVGGHIFYPPILTEMKTVLPITTRVSTGTGPFGTLLTDGSPAKLDTCFDWSGDTTNVDNHLAGGTTGGGNGTWTSSFIVTADPTQCWNTGTAPLHRLYCFQTDFTTTLTPPKAAGRLAFVTIGSFASGAGINAAHTLCQNEAMAVGLPMASTFKALLATSTASAASQFSGATPWVRVDGIPLVKNGPDLFAPTAVMPLLSALDVRSDGQGWAVIAFTGASSPTALATNNCNNWTSTIMSDVGSLGDARTIDGTYFSTGTTSTCDQGAPIYCLQP